MSSPGSAESGTSSFAKHASAEPAVSAPKPAPEAAEEGNTTSKSEHPSRREVGVRILVVEDEDSIASFVVKGLTAEGHSVERAATVAEASDWH